MSASGHLVMPKLGLTMEEGTVAKWHVRPGVPFAAGDVLVVVETDKIANDVEAPSAGVIDEMLVAEGDVVPVSAPIARWRLEEGGGAAPAAAAPAMRAQSPPRPEAPPVSDAPPKQSPRSSARILATPYARRLAREARVDLAALQGTGPHGRIKARDVEAAARRGTSTAVATRRPAPDVLAPRSAPEPAARALSLAQIDIDMRGIAEIARRFPAEQRTAVRIALVGMACARSFPGDGTVAVELGAHIVPLEPGANLRSRVTALVAAAQAPAEVHMASGGAVLLVPGGDATLFAPAAPVGWPAALGLAAPREILRRAASGDIETAEHMTLSLSYDTSVLTNAAALSFLASVKTQLEEPLLLLAG